MKFEIVFIMPATERQTTTTIPSRNVDDNLSLSGVASTIYLPHETKKKPTPTIFDAHIPVISMVILLLTGYFCRISKTNDYACDLCSMIKINFHMGFMQFERQTMSFLATQCETASGTENKCLWREKDEFIYLYDMWAITSWTIYWNQIHVVDLYWSKFDRIIGFQYIYIYSVWLIVNDIWFWVCGLEKHQNSSHNRTHFRF